MSYRMSEKKKSLLAYKEELLRDLKYFEKRIEEARLQKNDSFYFDDDDSDSEIDFMLDTAPHISQLKEDQDMLKTCLHATQELTNLYVLQSEVNVMVNDPDLEWETPVTEEGTWREVTAECRIDMVPVTIQFYAHQPNRLFGPTSYRGLRVQVLKAAHEAELNRSILSKATTPSDAVEVLRSYSAAHRARRSVLARLAEKYSDSLFMEPLADGGYVLKCANLLEVSWTLENKWSPIAAFHHKMKFNLEYMDEAYVKIIAHAYKELLEPALEADERLRLLSKIIATCLEAQGPTQELYESMESDVESENLRKRRTTLDEEIKEPTQKKQTDSDVMAPPKTVPKKTKPKGKENNVDNANQGKATKRPVTDNITDSAKKAKLSDQGNVKSNVNSKDSKKAKTNSAVTSESVDKEIQIREGGSSKNIVDTVNSNVKKSNVKPTKVQDKVVKDSEEKNDKNTKPNKVNKNKNETTKTTDDGISSNVKNIVDTNTVTDVQPSKNKASNKENVANKQNKANPNVANKNVITKSKSANVKSNKENGSSKDGKTNPNDNVASKNIPKSKSAININNNKENVSSKDTKTNPNDNVANKNIIPKSKSSSNVNNNKENGSSKDSKNNPNDNVASKNIPKSKSTININNNKENVSSKDTKTNPIDNVANKNIIPKSKSASNVNNNKENGSSKDGKDNPSDNIANKNIIPKSKSTSNVNNNKENGSSKDSKNNPSDNIANKNSMPKSKSATNINENVAKAKTSVKTSTVNKNTKGKSMDRPISANPEDSNSGQINTKPVLNLQKNIKAVKGTDKIKAKTNKENTTKAKENLNNNIKDTVVKNNEVNINKENKTQNEPVPTDIDSNKNDGKETEKPTKIKTNPKSAANKEKLAKYRASLKSVSKQHDEIQKDVVRNSLVSKVSDKISEKIDNVTTKNPVAKKTSNVANIDKNTDNTNKQISNKIDNVNKITETGNKHATASVKNAKNSPTKVNKMNILNPRNRKSIGNLKVNKNSDVQKEGLSKINTKIPQKLGLKHFRGDIKNKPLRISPRKMQSISKDSQNSSSLSTIVTGIPRLLKKTVPKLK